MKFKQLYISLLVVSLAFSCFTTKAETPAFYVEVPYTTINGKIIIEAWAEGVPGKFILTRVHLLISPILWLVVFL